MSKTIQLTGFVYNTPTGKVVDYGFEGLYQTSSKTSLETCTLTDNSLCPPLYENIELEPNIDYLAKVVDINEKKCYISFLAVDVEKYIQKPLGQGKGKILCVGSLIERKGLDLLLNALAEVKTEFELYLAGGGDEKENLIKLAKELKIEN